MNAHWQHLVIRMQTRITDQPAYLLHRRDWQNSSLILDLMTLDFGRLSLLAKGGRNSKSRGLFQPFNQLMVSWSGRHELKTLTSVDGCVVPLDERLYLPLLYVNELIEAFLPKFESSPELFALYGQLLKQVDADNIETQFREFERSAMTLLGYLPDLYVDANSGQPICSESYYLFQATSGFCTCQPNETNAIKGEKIIAWNEKHYADKTVGHIAKTVMRCVIDFNLQGKRLKSRDIYLQIIKAGHS
jgi:DNA repair protein RecO (recombination protein O)